MRLYANDKDMDKCRLSIIIPVYDAEDYLDRCINSVLGQDFASYEVILVDDGSTDSSGMICDRYSSTDARFRTLHKKNGGVSSARNAGLNIAKGEYIMFLDSDDQLLPSALEDMMDAVAGEDMLIGGYAVFVDGVPVRDVRPKASLSYGRDRLSDFFDDNIRRNCEMLDAPWAKLFRRKAISGLSFYEGLSYAEDKLFVFTALAGCTSISTIDSPVYGYHLRSGSLGSDISSDRHLEQMYVFLPMYADVLARLTSRFCGSLKLSSLYHKDLVGRYVCRLLNIYLTRRTRMLTKDNVAFLYDMMDGDPDLGLFSVRIGQFFNILLYKLHKPGFTAAVYRMTSFICSIFRSKR